MAGRQRYVPLLRFQPRLAVGAGAAAPRPPPPPPPRVPSPPPVLKRPASPDFTPQQIAKLKKALGLDKKSKKEEEEEEEEEEDDDDDDEIEDIVPKDEKEARSVCFDTPLRMCVVGESGSGKTHWVVEYLLQCKQFDQVIWCGPKHSLAQPIWKSCASITPSLERRRRLLATLSRSIALTALTTRPCKLPWSMVALRTGSLLLSLMIACNIQRQTDFKSLY